VRRALVLAVVLGLLASCGRRTQPLPPIIEVPETTTDLTVHQEAREIVLTWSYPALTRSGHQLTDLDRVEVWRFELPPGQEAVASGPQGEEMRRQLMIARGQLLARIDGQGLEQATRGDKLRFADPVAAPAAGMTPPTLSYAVRSRRRDGTPSALSNIVSWQPKPVPRQATGLRAEPDAERILLLWDPEEGVTYVVERRAERAPDWEIVAPLDLKEPTFSDTTARQEEGWRYRIRYLRMATAGPPSEELKVFYRDVYPPPSVTSLLCLPEDRTVRLQWDASSEQGTFYKVFRRRGAGEWAHLEEQTFDTEFVDLEPPAGDLEYAVKSTDVRGNQADAVTCLVRVDR
jgi:hypothetical protein